MSAIFFYKQNNSTSSPHPQGEKPDMQLIPKILASGSDK